jgi:site-specific DNA recombinase
MKPKAGVYCKISREDQSVFSLPSQQEACEKLAASKGFSTSPEFCFVDNGGRSTELDRPALSAMREAVRAGAVHAVLIYDIDRLARKLSHQLLLMEEFQKHGAEVLFVNAPNDDTPEGRMLLAMRGVFAEYERLKIAERTVRGSRRRAKEGKAYANVPFGYVLNKDGSVSAHPVNAGLVRDIFGWFGDGMSASEIARRLNENGVPPPKRAGGWIRGSVLAIARRRAYLGQLSFGKTTATEPRGRRRKPPKPGKSKKTSAQRQPESQWIRISVLPLVDQATFDRTQQAIDANRRWKSGRPSHSYLLTGLLRCSVCNAAVCGSYSHGWSYYRCSGRDEKAGTRSCASRGIRLDVLESAIWHDVTATLGNRKLLAAALTERSAELSRKNADHEAERLQLTAQMEKLARREFRARQGMLDADLSDSWNAFRDDLRTTQAKRRELERRMGALAPAPVVARPEDFTELCRRMKAAARITDRGQRRDFLRACIEVITVSPENVDILFEVDPTAAIAAIGSKPDDDPAGVTRNCQLRERQKIHRSKDRRRQSQISPQRDAPQSHRSGHHPAR